MTTKINTTALYAAAKSIRAVATELSNSGGDLDTLNTAAECEAGVLAAARYKQFHTAASENTLKLIPILTERAAAIESYAKGVEAIQKKAADDAKTLDSSIPQSGITTPTVPTTPTAPAPVTGIKV